MIYDAGNAEDRKKLTNPNPDICIIGAGAAGLAMAHSLIDSGENAKKVVVLECSRKNDQGSIIWGETHHRYEDHDIQPLYDGIMLESDGITDIAREGKTSREFFLHSRIKAYGGTTNCWEGWTRPLNDFDFGSSADPVARWPAKVKSDLVGNNRGDFYQRAMAYCSLDWWPFPYAYTQPDHWPGQAQATKSKPLGLMPGLDPYLQSQAVVQIGSPQKEKGPRDLAWGFQLRWGPEIKAAKNVLVFRNANVRRLQNASASILWLDATTVKDGPAKGDDFIVSAEKFVLAAGCIENVRLMLHSGFTTDQLPALGKYLMTHPLIEQAAIFKAATNVPPEVSRFCRGSTIEATDFHPAVFSMLAPTDKLMRGEVEDYPKIGDFRAWLRFPEQSGGWGTVNLCWEQKPVADNQVTLDSAYKDRLFGDPLPRVKIGLSDFDWNTRGVALETVGKVLLKGNGYATEYGATSNWPKMTGEHALGATRMADDARYGVVDSDCKVFYNYKLFVAGGSVFPTGGWANPTLTIIALALRLADHLKKD